MHIFRTVVVKIAKIISRVILKSVLLSSPLVKCSVWCNSFLWSRKKESLSRFESYLIVHPGLQRKSPSRAKHVTSSPHEDSDYHKTCSQPLRERTIFFSVYDVKSSLLFFLKPNCTAFGVILLPLVF